MSNPGKYLRGVFFLCLLSVPLWAPAPVVAADADHLILSEVVVQVRPPANLFGSKFIEIVNPTAGEIDLADVYLTDATTGPSTFYYNIVVGQNAGGGSGGDFHCRFPLGAVIAPGDTIVVALAGSDEYETAYGRLPDYELYEDDIGAPDSVPEMREAFPGSINAGLGSGQGNIPDLTPDGETVLLYYWDGERDLVQDLDYLIWGTFTSVRTDKTGVEIDGPDADTDTSAYSPDTPVGDQQVISASAHNFQGAFRRVSADEGAETSSGGNGVTGHDETSEPLGATWLVTADQQPPTEPTSWTPPAPIIFDVTLSPTEPYLDVPATVTATLEAFDGVSSVSVFYTIDGGALQEAVGSDNGDDTWSCVIPAQSSGTEVTWYLLATGGGGGQAAYPVSAPRSTESFTVGGPPAPEFQSVVLAPAAPFEGEDIAVTATVVVEGTVTVVMLYYSLDGGAFTEVTCSDNGDDTWTGSIPAQPADTEVRWYLTASADTGGNSTHPEGAPDVFESFVVTELPEGPAHLLLTEVCVASNDHEFIEIANPTAYDVDLGNYYLTDAIYNPNQQFYWKIVQPNPDGDSVGGGHHNDFIARFPGDAVIAAGDTITISIGGSDAFASVFAFLPTFELYEDGGGADGVPDLDEVFDGSIKGESEPTLTNGSETVILFYWDGLTDLVTDIDIFFWGESWDSSTWMAFSKTGVAIDGPDPGSGTTQYQTETAISSQDQFPGSHSVGESFQRVDFAEGTEIETGSNGVDGHDELSENLSATWAIGTAHPAEPEIPTVAGGYKLILKVPGRTFLPRSGEVFPINFVTKPQSQTALRIFDLEGRLVVSLFDSRFDGHASVIPDQLSLRTWDGRDRNFALVPAGMYVVHLSAVHKETGDLDTKTAPVVVATRLSK